MASWLVCSTPDRAVQVRALAGDIVLCTWVRHFTPTVPLSIQVYKWVPANLMLGVTLRWTSIPSRGEWKYSQSLHAMETGIRSGLMGHLARMQTLPFTFYPKGPWRIKRYYKFYFNYLFRLAHKQHTKVVLIKEFLKTTVMNRD